MGLIDCSVEQEPAAPSVPRDVIRFVTRHMLRWGFELEGTLSVLSFSKLSERLFHVAHELFPNHMSDERIE